MVDGPPVRVVPADEAGWADVQAVFGTRGAAASCQCQRYKLGPREAFRSFPVEERADRLREQICCDDPGRGPTAGLVAYVGDQPAGWCAVQPRPAYPGLLRSARVPWEGRTEDTSDADVWAVTCLLVRTGFRRRGLSADLVAAAVAHARERGARVLEGYPMVTTQALLEELHVGSQSVFRAAGFTEVSHPTPRRVVMRLEL